MKRNIFMKAAASVLALLILGSLLPMTADKAYAAAYTGCLSQHDSRWGSLSYGGGTISGTGCGILSLVNTVGYLSGQMMDIPSVAAWAHSVGAYNVNGDGRVNMGDVGLLYSVIRGVGKGTSV